MKTKALILGVQPPFEGPWIKLSDSQVWRSFLETCPADHEINGQCRIEVKDSEGSVTTWGPGERFKGTSARVILDPIEPPLTISLYVEAI